MRNIILIISCLLLLVSNVFAGSPDISYPVMREPFEPFVEALKSIQPDAEGAKVVRDEKTGCSVAFDPNVNALIVFDGGLNAAVYFLYSGQVEIYQATMFGWFPSEITDETVKENIREGVKKVYDTLFKPGQQI